jgi:hypothetical protein
MAEMVERLFSKWKTLSSNPSITKKRKKEERREKEEEGKGRGEEERG